MRLSTSDVVCKVQLSVVLLGGSFSLAGQPRILTADPQIDAYRRIESVLHAKPEAPDCGHPAFGPHITQTMDEDLGRYVFVFNIHAKEDDDRCTNSDRQRLEIKTEGSSSTPDYLKGFRGESVTFRWRFKLPAGFQPSTHFTHLHQIKAFDGDAGAPVLTLTAHKGSTDTLQVIHSNGSRSHVISETTLTPLVGVWLEVYEKVTYGSSGTYAVSMRTVSDGKEVFSYSGAGLDLWRKGSTVLRPKWGVYRSLLSAGQLRDEQVRFAGFCLAKGKDDCPAGVFGNDRKE
jgi:hypothetical protein